MIQSAPLLLHRLPVSQDFPIGGAQDSVSLYLPASAAGAPPLSPTYDSIWTDTSIATRVVGRLARNYGTSFEDIAVTTHATRLLVRQYVIPLTGLADVIPPLSGQTDPNVYMKCSGSNGSVISSFRVVDASGNNLTASVVRTFNTSGSANDYRVTSAGLFVPADLGSFIFSPTISGFNSLIEIRNTSLAILSYSYPSGWSGESTDLVKGAHINLAQGSSITNTSGAFVAVSTAGFGGISATPSDGYTQPTSIQDDSYFIVFEIGLAGGTSSPTRTFRFGDPSTVVISDGGTSTGCPFLFYPQAPVIF